MTVDIMTVWVVPSTSILETAKQKKWRTVEWGFMDAVATKTHSVRTVDRGSSEIKSLHSQDCSNCNEEGAGNPRVWREGASYLAMMRRAKLLIRLAEREGLFPSRGDGDGGGGGGGGVN